MISLPFVDEAKPLAHEFLLRIRRRGLKLPLSETSDFEKRLILANSHFFHYHIDLDTYLEYIRISDRSENISTLRLVPPDFWSPPPRITPDRPKSEDKKKETLHEPCWPAMVIFRSSKSVWKPLEQRIAEEEAEKQTKLKVSARPQQQTNKFRFPDEIEAVDSRTPNPPAWMKEAKELAQRFLNELRRHRGGMRADMVSDFERRLLRANKKVAGGKLLGYRYNNDTKKINIVARKDVRVDQLMMVPPSVESTEVADRRGTNEDEETGEERVEEVGEKWQKKTEEKNHEKKESNVHEVGMPFTVHKVVLPESKTPLEPPLHLEPSTLVEKLVTRGSEKVADATTMPEVDLLTTERLAAQMIGKKFLCTLHNFEDIQHLSVDVLQDEPLKLPIVLYDIAFKPEKQEHVKTLLGYLSEMKIQLPAICLEIDNSRAVVDVIIETRAREKVYLTNYLIHHGSAVRVKTAAEKRPSVDELLKIADEKKVHEEKGR